MKHATFSVDWPLMVLSWLFCALAVLILVLALTGCSNIDPVTEAMREANDRIGKMVVQ